MVILVSSTEVLSPFTELLLAWNAHGLLVTSLPGDLQAVTDPTARLGDPTIGLSHPWLKLTFPSHPGGAIQDKT